MKLSAYAYTNKGGRPRNEDSLYCGEAEGLFVLADGLGGHQSGQVASRTAVETVVQTCHESEEADLLTAFAAANTEILAQQAVPGQEEMRTTAVALRLGEDQGDWAYIGDSRLYHFSGGKLSSVTRDHSVTYRKYLGGEISYIDVYHDDDRSRLLRVLGRADCKSEGGSWPVSPGDAFLLCSDGFWEFVYNEEMEIDLCKAETPEQWAKLMLLRHIRRTPPGNDNFSLIAIFVEGCT